MPKTPDFSSNKDFIDLIKDKPKLLPETGWNHVGPSEDHGINFLSGWGNSSTSGVPASWYLSEDGEVRLRGKVTGGSVGSTIFTLPEEVRPEYLERYIVPIEDDVHLENIHFRAHQGEEFPDFYLQIWGDRYNGLPALHYYFDPVEDIWSRVTWRIDKSTRGYGTSPIQFVWDLIYQEMFDDAYYGYGGDNGNNSPPSISIDFANNLGAGYHGGMINGVHFTPGTITSYGGNSVAAPTPVIDLHATRTGSITDGGIWDVEVYENEVLRYTNIGAQIWGDSGHPAGAAGISSLLISHQYANFTGFMALDNISLGTSQGADDIMPVQTFDDGTFGLLVDDSEDGSGEELPTFVIANDS